MVCFYIPGIQEMKVKDLIISKFLFGCWTVWCVCVTIILIGLDHLNYGMEHIYYFHHSYLVSLLM